MEKVVLKPAGETKKRKCGHPFMPTFDVPSEDGLSITGYCIYCIFEKLNMKPCIKVQVNKTEDWRDKNKIKILYNE